MNTTVDLSQEKILSIQKAAEILIQLHKSGKLGGEAMPEDSNPGLPINSEENYAYFTLPMALNYQRNSYRLWESAKKTYLDTKTSDVFAPKNVINMEIDLLKEKLLKYGVALQPNKHPQIWMQLCQTFTNDFDGKIKELFRTNGNSVKNIKDYIANNKKKFPYLSGAKIVNYWLYVIGSYTDVALVDNEYITVAPDTHVLQASMKLGMINEKDIKNPKIREIVSEMWDIIFRGTKRNPIDIHTPLWLWSRGGFSVGVKTDD